jgi:hypothetical protein
MVEHFFDVLRLCDFGGGRAIKWNSHQYRSVGGVGCEG